MSILEKKPYSIVKDGFISFCDLFKFQAKENPRKTAVIFGEDSLTYEELNRRSSQLASYLRANGVQPETIIALSVQNGLNLIIGMLGILRSGGTYFPIDPNYPAERIKMMLDDAQPRIILTDQSLVSTFSNLTCKVIAIDKHPLIESINRAEEELLPDQLAYIMYTSGSSGRPKGIMMEHRALAYAISAHQKLHRDKFISLISGSISFDASLITMALTLISGGTVCVSKNEKIVNPEEIIALIEQKKINYTLCVPSFYGMLLKKQKTLPSLKSIDLGGENIPNVIPDIHAHVAPNSTLYNIYGPSEYAIGATYAKIYDPITGKVDKITIGKAFPGTQVYVLDENLKEVPVGGKGEIFIGGPGLARGYLNQENLSKEKFVWVSFFRRDPIRLYRTGDIGRFLQDGNLEFLGRKDYQIKIRGYRIELGEIEHLICQHPEINEAVVISREDSNGNKRLIAYFSTRIGQEFSDKLRDYLQGVLPRYMVPSVCIQIEHWPRTPNGKIDRSALLNSLEHNSLKDSIKQPSSLIEKEIFQIWQQLLDRETFGVEDNFFDIGGDSIQIVSLQLRLQEVFGREVSISNLLHYPTISQLAQYLSNAKAVPLSSSKDNERVRNQKSSFLSFKKFYKEN